MFVRKRLLYNVGLPLPLHYNFAANHFFDYETIIIYAHSYSKTSGVPLCLFMVVI